MFVCITFPLDFFFFFNSVMDEAEILKLKPGTPRLPARRELSLWEGGIAPCPRRHAWVGTTHIAALGVVCPRSFLQPTPGFSPGSRKLNCDN